MFIETEIPEFEEYDEFESNESNSDSNINDDKLSFVPAPLNPPMVLSSGKFDKLVEVGGKVIGGIKIVGNGYQFYRAIKDGSFEQAGYILAGEEGAVLGTQLKEGAKVVGNILGGGGTGDTGTGINVPPQGPDSGSRDPGDRGLPMSYLNATRLSIEPHPTEVRFNTGIKPDCFTPEYNSTQTNYSYPLHYTGVKFSFPDSSDTSSLIGKFFNQSILQELRTTIQRNVTYSTTITVTDLNNYLNALADALQAYYTCTRYLTYAANPMNKNEGMLYLANTITNTVGDNYLALRRYLQGLPIPPNLNTFIFWFTQHYVAEDIPGSPLLAVLPFTLGAGALPDWAELSSTLSTLTSYSTVASTLGKAIPTWYNTQLLTGVANPLHDPGFTTMWTNLPFRSNGTGGGTHDVRGPSITDDDSSIKYNAWGEHLDGGIFALMTGTADGTTWLPSLIRVVTSTASSNVCNRLSFYNSSFVDAYYHTSSGIGRDETYMISSFDASASRTNIPIAAQRVWGVTPRTIANCAYQMLDWLMSWDTITSRVEKALAKVGPYNPAKGKYTGKNVYSSSKPKSKGRSPKHKSKS